MFRALRHSARRADAGHQTAGVPKQDEPKCVPAMERGEMVRSPVLALSASGVRALRSDQLLWSGRSSLPRHQRSRLTSEDRDPSAVDGSQKRSADARACVGDKHNADQTLAEASRHNRREQRMEVIAATHNILKLWRHPNPRTAGRSGINANPARRTLVRQH